MSPGQAKEVKAREEIDRLLQAAGWLSPLPIEGQGRREGAPGVTDAAKPICTFQRMLSTLKACERPQELDEDLLTVTTDATFSQVTGPRATRPAGIFRGHPLFA